MKEKIIQYWQGLQSREQKLLFGMGIFAVFLCFYLIFESTIVRNADMKQQIAREQQLLEWMQPVVQQIMIARTQSDGIPITSANILAQVELSLAEAGLSGEIVSLDLIANNQVQLVFQNVVYEALVDWLYALSHQGVVIHEFTAVKVEEVGAVNASMLFSAA